jgi:hypothetical protein
MAVGLIEALKSVEERFGAEGHDVVRAALSRVGDRIVDEMSDGVEAPPDATPAEMTSLIASWINEVCYASIEKPRVEDSEHADFDIHYCPHEDVYGAFDCRVQRYFVEGMIAAGRRHFGNGMFDVRFTARSRADRACVTSTCSRRKARQTRGTNIPTVCGTRP